MIRHLHITDSRQSGPIARGALIRLNEQFGVLSRNYVAAKLRREIGHHRFMHAIGIGEA
jgi:hypothetical protein